MFKTIIPRDRNHWLELRKPVLTSTEIPAIFGLSPYATPFEIWHRKRDGIDIAIEPNERMRWGSRLESTIAAGVAEDNVLQIRKMDEFIFDPVQRIGASFDFAIGDDGILEIKNVDSLTFKDGWLIDGNNVEAPPFIEMQVQVQLYVSGRKFAMIAALIGGNRVVIIERERDEAIINAIIYCSKRFWESIDNNREPSPNFEKDSAFISKLYRYAEVGKVIDADSTLADLALKYRAEAEAARLATERKDGIKAQILMKINDAEKVIGQQFTISAGTVGPAHIEFDREAFRNFRIFWRKEK